MVNENFNPYEIIKGRYESNVDKFINSELFAPFGNIDSNIKKDIENNKIAIYTAIAGDYDILKDPKVIDENCDYICFTDNENIESDIWDIRYMEDSVLDDNRKAKQYKIFPNKYLPEYKYSFWIDGTFKITGSIREYVSKYINSPMLVVVHPERDSIFDEAESTYHFPRYPKYIIARQVEYYKNQGIPANYGLPSLGAIFREHKNPQIINLMNQWWEEVTVFTNQDQLSFTYLMWKNNFHPSVAKEYIWFNDYWTVEGKYHHKSEIEDYIVSSKLINKYEDNIEDKNYLTKKEIYLLLNDIEALQCEAFELNDERNFWDKKVLDLKDSTSWKLTSVLRKLNNRGNNE